MNACTFRLRFLPIMAFLTLALISGCSSTPVNKNTPQDPIVNQSVDPPQEVEFTKNVKQLIAQVAKLSKFP